MGKEILHLLGSTLAHYGYAAIAVILLLENLGLPLPGESVLLLAGFLAASQQRFTLTWIIAVGVIATTAGSLVGYLLGHHGGRPLLERYQRSLHVSDATLQKGEKLFARYGAVAIVLGRFVAGLRIFAGPLAGVLRMRWESFLFFSFLGSVLWVSAVSSAAFFFGQHWNRLLHLMGRLNILFAAAAVILLLLFWWRETRAKTAKS
jgi:membrane-associated protein